MFTQLLSSNATAIGCGGSRFSMNGYRWFEIACNYAAGNIEGSPVYMNSTKGGSGCATGTDATYKALCSDKEQLDANYRPSMANSGSPDDSSVANFTSKNYCTTKCGASHVGCNATDVSYLI